MGVTPGPGPAGDDNAPTSSHKRTRTDDDDSEDETVVPDSTPWRPRQPTRVRKRRPSYTLSLATAKEPLEDAEQGRVIGKWGDLQMKWDELRKSHILKGYRFILEKTIWEEDARTDAICVIEASSGEVVERRQRNGEDLRPWLLIPGPAEEKPANSGRAARFAHGLGPTAEPYSGLTRVSLAWLRRSYAAGKCVDQRDILGIVGKSPAPSSDLFSSKSRRKIYHTLDMAPLQDQYRIHHLLVEMDKFFRDDPEASRAKFYDMCKDKGLDKDPKCATASFVKKFVHVFEDCSPPFAALSKPKLALGHPKAVVESLFIMNKSSAPLKTNASTHTAPVGMTGLPSHGGSADNDSGQKDDPSEVQDDPTTLGQVLNSEAGEFGPVESSSTTLSTHGSFEVDIDSPLQCRYRRLVDQHTISHRLDPECIVSISNYVRHCLNPDHPRPRFSSLPPIINAIVPLLCSGPSDHTTICFPRTDFLKRYALARKEQGVAASLGLAAGTEQTIPSARAKIITPYASRCQVAVLEIDLSTQRAVYHIARPEDLTELDMKIIKDLVARFSVDIIEDAGIQYDFSSTIKQSLIASSDDQIDYWWLSLCRMISMMERLLRAPVSHRSASIVQSPESSTNAQNHCTSPQACITGLLDLLLADKDMQAAPIT